MWAKYKQLIQIITSLFHSKMAPFYSENLLLKLFYHVTEYTYYVSLANESFRNILVKMSLFGTFPCV